MRQLRVWAIAGLLLLPAGMTAAQPTAPQSSQPPPTSQPSPEALEAANQLFSILSVDMMGQLTAQMTNLFWPMLEQKAHEEKIDAATIAELRKEFDRIQLTNLTDMMKQAPPIYARHFTVTELHEMAAFYRTPTGAKALRELPLVMGEFVAVLTPRMQDIQRQTGESFNRILRERGYIK